MWHLSALCRRAGLAVSGTKDDLMQRLCAAAGVAAAPATPELPAAAAARAQRERDRRQRRTPLFGTIDVRKLPLSFLLCEHPPQVRRDACVCGCVCFCFVSVFSFRFFPMCFFSFSFFLSVGALFADHAHPAPRCKLCGARTHACPPPCVCRSLFSLTRLRARSLARRLARCAARPELL